MSQSVAIGLSGKKLGGGGGVSVPGAPTVPTPMHLYSVAQTVTVEEPKEVQLLL